MKSSKNEIAIALPARVGLEDFALECVTTPEGVELLEDDWRDLEKRDTALFTYFQTYDWCHVWCRKKFAADVEKRNAQIFVFVLRKRGVVVMLFPLMISKTRTKLDLLTELTDPLAQYTNLLFDPKHVTVSVAKEVWKSIYKFVDADAILLTMFPKGSFLDLVLGDAGFKEQSELKSSFFDLSVHENFEAYHASLPKNIRKSRNRKRNKLQKLGTVDYEVVAGGSAAYRELVEKSLEMKQRWLEETGRKASDLIDSSTYSFLSDLAGTIDAKTGRADGAVAHALKLNGTVIAIELGMVREGHYYSYLGSFDWRYRDVSVGKIQIEMALKWAFETGLDRFDFLGDPAVYKANWTNSTAELVSRSIPLSKVGMVYCHVWKANVRPILKTIYAKMGSNSRRAMRKLLFFQRD